MLWENPSPSDNFVAQDINLSSGDYNLLEIAYSFFVGDLAVAGTVRALKGCNIRLQAIRLLESAKSQQGDRLIDYISDTQLSAKSAYYQISGEQGYNETTGFCIPKYIIGYKLIQ